jgi:hypothetical protein
MQALHHRPSATTAFCGADAADAADVVQDEDDDYEFWQIEQLPGDVYKRRRV